MIYNHKSNDIVQDVIVECICPIIEDLAGEFEMLRRIESLAIYAPSSIAREILARILEEFYGVWVNNESCNELLYKDDNKVIINLCDDGMIFVESAYDEDGVIKRTEAVLSYVYDEFTSKEVEDIALEIYSVLVFGFEEETEEDIKEDAELAMVSTDTYFVNGKKVDKNTYEKAFESFNKKHKEIGEKYFDNANEVLFSYCNWMNTVAKLHRLFH